MKIVLYILGAVLVVLGLGEIAMASRFGVLNLPGTFMVIGGLIVVWIGGKSGKKQADEGAGTLKKCPKHAEEVKKEALICRFCRFKFPPLYQKKPKKNLRVGSVPNVERVYITPMSLKRGYVFHVYIKKVAISDHTIYGLV